MSNRRPWTQAELDLVWQHHTLGATSGEIAKKTRGDTNTINAILNQNRCFAPDCKRKEYYEAINQLIDLVEGGVGSREAARRVGLGVQDAFVRLAQHRESQKLDGETAYRKPKGVTAPHGELNWWLQNQMSFERGFLRAHPEYAHLPFAPRTVHSEY